MHFYKIVVLSNRYICYIRCSYEILELKTTTLKLKRKNFNKLWEQKFEIMRRGSKMTNMKNQWLF